ncbi:hypothetical protein CAG54_11240 [Vibrio sp. V27_P1S3P104]|nr:hypothetical protein [Vibrio sp. V28_P6S34P95]NAX05961.1 hypothetical protein [Vibrio sp. V30_P3S12P165]NAX33333.1 hypothetical protein [Vibrio sp. V29_P1S30P107]NAX38071.1 hypothetical protein [Vibrio sp. V27_P1S3P104]NAX41178.1 hypothetical protein [Vibrio sp. V26_P1S5P106]
MIKDNGFLKHKSADLCLKNLFSLIWISSTYNHLQRYTEPSLVWRYGLSVNGLSVNGLAVNGLAMNNLAVNQQKEGYSSEFLCLAIVPQVKQGNNFDNQIVKSN